MSVVSLVSGNFCSWTVTMAPFDFLYLVKCLVRIDVMEKTYTNGGLKATIHCH